ncbi:hypothetical protein EDD18DRAFT_442398 [Armillaria luteobubalina]|uniref:Uncharacterized protein n=1 Tax=Armillaria luteobubalina TaxID=153913 RepID=A0AA39UQG9_9AGAR|nr:hypothetical protein EDD18DRAFT_442398 [Armillaria luteobubalina]
MTESTKDSSDDILASPLPLPCSNATSLSPPSPTEASPPPYSIDVDQDVQHRNDRHHLYSANPEVTILHISALTYFSRLSSKRTLPAIAIFVICMLLLTLYAVGPSAKENHHQVIHDSLSWAHLTPSERCLRFGTREYSAQLMGVPTGEDGLRWCKDKTIIIHSFNIGKPEYCTVDVDESAPTNHRILGHWTVDFKEPSCKTLWENFQDKGCVANGSKTHRVEAHMGNHQPPWDNWREMCSTTPADYGGHHFDQPSSCDHRGIFGGIWGVWFVEDESC